EPCGAIPPRRSEAAPFGRPCQALRKSPEDWRWHRRLPPTAYASHGRLNLRASFAAVPSAPGHGLAGRPTPIRRARWKERSNWRRFPTSAADRGRETARYPLGELPKRPRFVATRSGERTRPWHWGGYRYPGRPP